MIQYEFQVVEYKHPITKQILRVELQTRRTYRDEYMNIIRTESWMSVPRVEMFVNLDDIT
jgi:hypothetical protein